MIINKIIINDNQQNQKFMKSFHRWAEMEERLLLLSSMTLWWRRSSLIFNDDIFQCLMIMMIYFKVVLREFGSYQGSGAPIPQGTPGGKSFRYPRVKNLWWMFGVKHLENIFRRWIKLNEVKLVLCNLSREGLMRGELIFIV